MRGWPVLLLLFWLLIGAGVGCVYGQQPAADEYVVQEGDSLSSIARSFGVTSRSIMTLNRLGTAPLKVGQVIRIPGTAPAAAAVAAPAVAPVVPVVPVVVTSVVQVVPAAPPVVAVPVPSVKAPREKPVFADVELPKASWPLENVVLAGLSSATLRAEESSSLADVLQNVLVEADYFNVRARSDIEAVLKEQTFQKNQSCEDPAYLVEVGKLLATKKIVGGSIGKVGETYIVSLRMVNVETAAIEVSEQREVVGDADELIDLIKYVGRLLCAKYAGKMTAQK